MQSRTLLHSVCESRPVSRCIRIAASAHGNKATMKCNSLDKEQTHIPLCGEYLGSKPDLSHHHPAPEETPTTQPALNYLDPCFLPSLWHLTTRGKKQQDFPEHWLGKVPRSPVCETAPSPTQEHWRSEVSKETARSGRALWQTLPLCTSDSSPTYLGPLPGLAFSNSH